MLAWGSALLGHRGLIFTGPPPQRFFPQPSLFLKIMTYPWSVPSSSFRNVEKVRRRRFRPLVRVAYPVCSTQPKPIGLIRGKAPLDGLGLRGKNHGPFLEKS